VGGVTSLGSHKGCPYGVECVIVWRRDPIEERRMTTDMHGGSLGRTGLTRRAKTRIGVAKTYKLFINGQFPRTESGRSMAVNDRRGRTVAHLCHGSRKDLRDAVEAARGAEAKWSGMDAALRGQILYRLAEMLEARADEFVDALEITRSPSRRASRSAKSFSARDEVIASVDRIVSFAGWTDKFQQVLGHRHPVAGPYHVFSVPGPCGVTAVVAPDEPPLLGLVSLCAPALCVGATVVALASERHPLVAALLGEALATSDLPPGVINILTGFRAELLPHIANHREIRALSAANLNDEESTILRRGSAENLKRVSVRDRETPAAWYDAPSEHGPDRLEPLIDLKTIWHPSAC